MKKIVFVSAVILLTASFKKNADEVVVPIIVVPLKITKADFALNFKPNGPLFNYAKINVMATPIAVLSYRDYQTLDFTTLSDTATEVQGTYVTPTILLIFQCFLFFRCAYILWLW